jgi:hypothetical protein
MPGGVRAFDRAFDAVFDRAFDAAHAEGFRGRPPFLRSD